MTMPDTLRGGCLCGGVAFTVAAPPARVSYCHCRDCRRATGAPVSVFVGVPASTLAHEGAPPAVFRSSTHVERWFCPACGTPLAYLDDRLPDEIYLYVGVLDAADALVPERHAFTEQAVPWLEIADDLPRHARFSRARPSGR